MYTEMTSAFGDAMRTIFAPVQKMNRMAIAQTERVIAMQLESAKAYRNLGIGQWKTATAVNDPWSLVSYLVKQGAYATEIAEQVVADVRKLREMGGDFVEKARSVAQEDARAIGSALSSTPRSLRLDESEVGKAATKKTV